MKDTVERRMRACLCGFAWLAALCGCGPVRADNDGYAGMTVSVVLATRECFHNLVPVDGVLEPKTVIAVRPDRDDLVVGEVLVEAGDSVLAGQILARLVSPPGAPPQTETIRSPAAGIAIGVSATVGSYASSKTADPMFRIIAGGELEMRGQVPISRLSLLSAGQPTSLHIMGQDKLDGRVIAIESGVDAQTQLGTVHLSVVQDPRLKPGAFARAEIDTGENCQTTVPLSALLYAPEGAVVQVVVDDHVETRRVDVGLVQNGFVQILNEVKPGDKVISLSGGFLREGDRVRAVLQAPQPKT